MHGTRFQSHAKRQTFRTSRLSWPLKVCWLRCKERVPIDSSGASVQTLRIETLRLPRTDDYWVARTLEAGVVVESRAFLPDLVRGNGREQGG